MPKNEPVQVLAYQIGNVPLFELYQNVEKHHAFDRFQKPDVKEVN